ncbi:phosphomevalonate kinase [Fructilactobacillus carniphilus]|uniref:phosphomevalonate kinase n=1 Tax=Fructilactobacillus carniphilus TaxID=2940297 RepID=A0ABY5C1C7_9LACO|nr:phosphomevalonate kinase [Fructilactobacillus carniphilus]USS91111.1 phosphomevalonate kinase [Fructilactobacillus carniphilus]
MIKTSTPGKLYLAGEYAVVENGNPAIIAAVNRFVTVTIDENTERCSITSKQYENHLVHWERINSRMVVDDRDNPFQYIIAAIQVTEDYVQALGKPTQKYHLSVNSELDSGTGKKYGLGSSAAVTVATIKALCQLYQLNVSKVQLFKLAAIAHFSVQGNGSLGDVASSVFGGLITYSSFDRQWLSEFLHKITLPELLKLEWPRLEITPLQIPPVLRFLVGWTGSPASTSQLIDKVELKKGKHGIHYERFLHDSNKCVREITNGFRQNNIRLIMQNIKKNRELLQSLSQMAGVSIETPKLARLIEIAEQYGGVAKTSGAGGGDCGIVLIKSDCDIAGLKTAWQEAGIDPLDLAIYNY